MYDHDRVSSTNRVSVTCIITDQVSGVYYYGPGKYELSE